MSEKQEREADIDTMRLDEMTSTVRMSRMKGTMCCLVIVLTVLLSTPVLADKPNDHYGTNRGWRQDLWDFVKGEQAPSAVYAGMWSRHVVNSDDDYRSNHELLGLCYRGMFVGTFRNSHDNRGWGAGVQRDVYRGSVRDATWRFGYRAGIVYGYEELSLFDTKLFPFIQTYADLSYKQGGVELSWAGSTLLIGFFWRI
jgi:hypothetical protein